MKTSRTFFYAVVLWTFVSCGNARRLEKSLDLGERGSNLTQDAVQHVTSTSERVAPQQTTLNLIRDIPSIPEDSNIQSLKNDDQVQVTYERKITVDKDSSEDSARNKSVDSVKNDVISYKFNKTGPSSFLTTDTHISHTSYEHSSSVTYDDEYEGDEDSLKKDTKSVSTSTEESKIDLEKKIIEAKKKEKSKKEIFESVTVPTDYSGHARIEKPYKDNSISVKLKEKNKDSISEALDDRRSTTIRISTSSDKNSDKSSDSEHDNKPLDSLDIFKIVSSGIIDEESVNQSLNSVINANGVNSEFKNRVKYSLKKTHDNVTEGSNSSTNILSQENAKTELKEDSDSQAAHSDVLNGAVRLLDRERIVPFQPKHQTESSPTKLDMFGTNTNPPSSQPLSPTSFIKPSLAFKQQLANKIKGLESAPAMTNSTLESVDDNVEKTTGKSSTKVILKKKQKSEHSSPSSEMHIPPTATAWTLVSMRTAVEGSSSRKPESEHSTTSVDSVTRSSPKFTTLPPVSRVKSFVPWSTRLHKTTPKPSPTTPTIEVESIAKLTPSFTAEDSEGLLSSSNNDQVHQNVEEVRSAEEMPLPPTTERHSVIRTTIELDRNTTESSLNLIQSFPNDVMVKDQSSTVGVSPEKPLPTQSSTVETVVENNSTVGESRNLSSPVLQNKSIDTENAIDARQLEQSDKVNVTVINSEAETEKSQSQVKNATVNEVLSSDINENINEVKSENSEIDVNTTVTKGSQNPSSAEKPKTKSNTENNDFDQNAGEFDIPEDGKDAEDSEEDEKPKQTTTVLPLIEQSETTVMPDSGEDDSENDRDEEESLLPIDKTVQNQNKTEVSDTVIEIKPISTTSSPIEHHTITNGSYVTSFDIIAKDNITQVVTKTPAEGDKNWYDVEPKVSSNTTEKETSPSITDSVEMTTLPTFDTSQEPESTTDDIAEETDSPPATNVSEETSPTASVSTSAETTQEVVTEAGNVEDSPACIKLHFFTSPFKLCFNQLQVRENIAAQLSNENVTLDQIIIMGLNDCQMKKLSDEEGELEVYICFVDKNREPSPMIRNEFLRRKENSPSINFGDVVSTEQPGTTDEGIDNVLAAIILSVIAAICLVLLGILLVVIRKRQGRFNYGQRCTPVSLDDYSLDNISVYNSVRRKGAMRASKRSYGNPAFDDPGGPTHSINFAGLANFSNDREALDEEFNQIPAITVKPDELPAGAENKNRYANVIPLPETRVLLQVKPSSHPIDEYINANYIKGTKGKDKLYIATQAPMQNTVEDFWKMVWQQQTKVILMLTALNENGVEKCADYLPQLEVSDCHRLFKDFQVTLKNHEVREKYLISSLELKNLETNSCREVTHLWYSSWPTQGVPDDGSAMIAFLIEARSYMRGAQGPTVVHCSPGTGRTGTVIAIDLCIRDFETQRSVDIPRTVYALRRNRAGAVQTKDQYAFIYQVLNLYATKLTGGALDSI